jgi:hypothetical protein
VTNPRKRQEAPIKPKEKQKPGDVYDPTLRCWVPAAQFAATVAAGVVVKGTSTLIIETVGVDVTHMQASGGPYTKSPPSSPESLARLRAALTTPAQHWDNLANQAADEALAIATAEELGAELKPGTPTAAEAAANLRTNFSRWFGTGAVAAFFTLLTSPSNAGSGSDLGYRCR